MTDQHPALQQRFNFLDALLERDGVRSLQISSPDARDPSAVVCNLFLGSDKGVEQDKAVEVDDADSSQSRGRTGGSNAYEFAIYSNVFA